MEILKFEFAAGSRPTKKALVGCVGSGDLEILMQPSQTEKMSIQVVTSVDGSSKRWENLFERMFSEQELPLYILIYMTLVQHRVLFAYV